ncbi:MAG: glucose-1-phosphate adenylyltransferase [Chloroflexota bacterium]|nr:glucose-1-phosphate adenylyltransferase [Chloroflexota bacterium]
MHSLKEILAVVLGGGQGKRLYPLTLMRSKPAVPIAGKYRLIDIPISNCINSAIYKIAVLTQFNSVSLHHHITGTYNFDSFHTGWVQIWAAEQTMERMEWYQGTADAVRKQLLEIQSSRSRYVLILSGDHLYRMDYSKMAQSHWENKADVTVAVQPIDRANASRFGLLKWDDKGEIIDFAEKPKDPQVLDDFVCRDDPDKPYLASMGIYMFNLDTLVNILSLKSSGQDFNDFGYDIIPYCVKNKPRVYGYEFSGYWRDIGTIRSFYEANLDLTSSDPSFDIYNPHKRIFTHARFLPGSRLSDCRLKNVLIAEGCMINDTEIDHAVIGLRSIIKSGVRIKDSILMGADYYDDSGSIPIQIGENCEITGAIIDKNVRMGQDVTIKPFPRGTEFDMDTYSVKDGIVVVPKRTVLPSGTYIGPEE